MPLVCRRGLEIGVLIGNFRVERLDRLKANKYGLIVCFSWENLNSKWDGLEKEIL